MQDDQANSRVSGDSDDNGTELRKSQRNRKSGGAVAVHPKSDVRHWRSRLFKNGSTRNGKRTHSAEWSVRIAHAGRREQFNLRTPNAEAAAARALKIYRSVIGAGWTAAIAEFKPEAATPPPAAPDTASVTVGMLIEAATRLSSARRESLDTYAKALRRITVGVLELNAGKEKFDFTNGTATWRSKVDVVPLEELTPARVLAWKNAFLKAASNPQERKSAAVTVNSLLRNSKALLSKRIRPFLEKEMPLPALLWFEGVPLEKEPSLRYHSTIDAGTILQAAMEELAPAEPETFKSLLLTLLCGLRRSEADSVLWSQVDFEAGTLEIMDTEHRALKSADSAGKIALDPEVVALLQSFRAGTQSPFILETPKNARRFFGEHKSRTYRCDATHKKLIEWLRLHGVKGKRPIHTMRKEIGSIIASREGIFAASRFLRHSDIRITSRLYADSKVLVSSGLGSLLEPPKKNVIQGEFKPAAEIAEGSKSDRRMSEEFTPFVDWTKVGPELTTDKDSCPEHLVELRVLTAILILAIHGEDADLKKFLPQFERMVETPFGISLAVCAGEARQRGPAAWAAFSESLRLPGYHLLQAVFAWQEKIPRTSILQQYLEMKESSLSSLEHDHFNNAIRDAFLSGMELKSIFQEWQRLQTASQKRKQRSKSPRNEDVFAAAVKRDWITAALWCRDTKGILKHYPWMPQSTALEVEKSVLRIDKAISSLGFSSSRKRDFSKEIERAEAAGLRAIKNPP